MNNIELVTFLLIKGAHPSTLTIDLYTPLQLAVLHHSPSILELLLEQRKTDVNQLTCHGTALHLSVRNEDIGCLEALLQHGASLQVSNFEDKLPIDICESEKIAAILSRREEMGNVVVPNIVKGGVYRVTSTTYRLKERELTLNPFHNSLLIQLITG